MKKLRIGYQPLSADLSQPGDRRRVVFWAKHRGHEIVTDLNQPVDVILLSEKADFGAFPKKASRAPVIFDLVDAYLAKESHAKDWFRGSSKVLTGQLSGAPKAFTKFVENLCLSAAAVICSSPEQKETIAPFSENVHVILDSHDELPMIPFSQQNEQSRKYILWEGMPATIGGVSQIANALESIQKNRDLEMRFVTNMKYFLLLGRFLERDTSALLEKTMGNMYSHSKIISWSTQNLVEEAKRASVAVIPIDLSNPLQYLKPENRLLIMWRLGLPCLTSPSPAYKRVASIAQTDTICSSLEDWQVKMTKVLDRCDVAEEIVSQGQTYLKEFHNKDLLLARWDAAFESVL